MDKKLNKSKIIKSILISMSISGISFGQTLDTENIYNEYTIVEKETSQNLDEESWNFSVENIKGIEVSEKDLYAKQEEEKIHRGRVILKENNGVIYTIVDPVNVDKKLNIKTKDIIYISQDKKIENELKFYTFTNYEKDIERYELLIYRGKDSYRRSPIAVIKGDKLDNDIPITWNGEIDEVSTLKKGEYLGYVLRVYSSNGEYDETGIRYLMIKTKKLKEKKELILNEEEFKKSIYGTSILEKQNIAVFGAKVRFYGQNLIPRTKIMINNKKVQVNNFGKFIYENISNTGKELYKIVLENNEKQDVESYSLEVDSPKSYDFLVGLVGLTYGKEGVSGSDEIISISDDFESSYYKKGRLAAYYKGIRDKYKITAQVDTWEKEIKHLFSDFHERNKNSILRKIDKTRDQFKFGYGDDSEIYYDVDTEGKIYTRVDWDKSQVLWGNYKTGFDKGRYNQYNRSLYGARGEYNSLQSNKFGSSKNSIMFFASNPETNYKRDKFLGTGGSIYNLSEIDIVVGSPKLTVELRDKATGRLINRKILYCLHCF